MNMDIIIKTTEKARDKMQSLIQSNKILSLYKAKSCCDNSKSQMIEVPLSVTSDEADMNTYKLSVENSDDITRPRFVSAVMTLLQSNKLSFLSHEDGGKTMTFGMQDERGDNFALNI